MTLYSRAHRIGLNEASCLLRGLRKNVSFDFFWVDVARALAQPAFELGVPLEQELERFADDVGRICADELGVSVQVVSDFFLQANLKGCSLWLFGWCFQYWQRFSSFCLSLRNTARITNCRLRSLHADETWPRAARGGRERPHEFWAAASRTKWGRSRPSQCFVRVQMSPVSFTYPPFFEESVVALWVTLGLEPHLKCRVSVSRHPIFSCCPRIPLLGPAP